jgi:hypothetical protein
MAVKAGGTNSYHWDILRQAAVVHSKTYCQMLATLTKRVL